MAELSRRAVLDGRVAPGLHGRWDGPPGLRVEELVPAGMVSLSGVADPESLHTALAALGLAEAPSPRRCTAGHDVRLLWCGPGQYLVESVRLDGPALAQVLDEALEGRDETVVDLSHGRAVLRLTGPASVDALLAGCALDLEAFAPGTCASTLVSHFHVLLHRPAPEVFEVYVARTLARSFHEWLVTVASEHGVETRVPG